MRLSVSVDRWKEHVLDLWPEARFTRADGSWIAHVSDDVYGDAVGIYVLGGYCGLAQPVTNEDDLPYLHHVIFESSE